MLDIIFLSYDEPNADKNWTELKARFPFARRVHGVNGIANAHFEAAKKANTDCFYVVDADAEILGDFKFDYKPPEYDQQYVHIWQAFNPVLGIAYGYGGVKLFCKKMFSHVKNELDFSTTLASGIKLMEDVACITRFNSDHIRAYRGAFREAVKLFIKSNDASLSTEEKKEARERLAAWADPVSNCAFREFIVAGVQDAISYVNNHADKNLLVINNHQLIASLLQSKFPEIDFSNDPTPSSEHPMKHEFFFTTRIASVMYDSYVLDNLPLTELRDAISDGQLLSKNWLVEVLAQLIKDEKIKASVDKPLRVAVLGGWIGTLSLMLFSWDLPVKITSVDLDPRANRIAEKLNWDQQFLTLTQDMYTINYDDYDVIINTSSEHIENIPRWREAIPAGKIVIVQNNDFHDGAGHVSTVPSSNALRKQLKLSEVIYEGTRQFPQYSRFMLIGKT